MVRVEGAVGIGAPEGIALNSDETGKLNLTMDGSPSEGMSKCVRVQR